MTPTAHRINGLLVVRGVDKGGTAWHGPGMHWLGQPMQVDPADKSKGWRFPRPLPANVSQVKWAASGLQEDAKPIDITPDVPVKPVDPPKEPTALPGLFFGTNQGGTVTGHRGDANNYAVKTSWARDLIVTNVSTPQNALGGVLIEGGSKIVITNLACGIVEKYGVYCDDGTNILIDGITANPVFEAGIRIMTRNNVVTIRKANIDIRPGRAFELDLATRQKRKQRKVPTSLRIHDGKTIIVESSTLIGDVNLGPMVRGDGGEDENDPKKRREMLARTLDGVQFRNVDIIGQLVLLPGLRNALIENVEVNIPADGTQYNWYDPLIITGTYPSPQKARPGDVARRFENVVIRNCHFRTDVPGRVWPSVEFAAKIPDGIRFEGCTYNGVKIS